MQSSCTGSSEQTTDSHSNGLSELRKLFEENWDCKVYIAPILQTKTYEIYGPPLRHSILPKEWGDWKIRYIHTEGLTRSL